MGPVGLQIKHSINTSLINRNLSLFCYQRQHFCSCNYWYRYGWVNNNRYDGELNKGIHADKVRTKIVFRRFTNTWKRIISCKSSGKQGKSFHIEPRTTFYDININKSVKTFILMINLVNSIFIKTREMHCFLWDQ